jgi:hypothetical protein
MSVSCKGCGRSFSEKGYNVHHSHRGAKPECQGRENARFPSVAVNARNYRVTVQNASRPPSWACHSDPDSDDLESESSARDGDSLGGPGQDPSPSHRDGADSDAAGSGPGE